MPVEATHWAELLLWSKSCKSVLLLHPLQQQRGFSLLSKSFNDQETQAYLQTYNNNCGDLIAQGISLTNFIPIIIVLLGTLWWVMYKDIKTHVLDKHLF